MMTTAAPQSSHKVLEKITAALTALADQNFIFLFSSLHVLLILVHLSEF